MKRTVILLASKELIANAIHDKASLIADLIAKGKDVEIRKSINGISVAEVTKVVRAR